MCIRDRSRLAAMQPLTTYIQSELNVFDVQLVSDAEKFVTFQMVGNKKELGKRYGKQLKQLAPLIATLSLDQVVALKAGGEPIMLDGGDMKFELLQDDIEIQVVPTDTVPANCALVSDGNITVMMDVSIGQKQLEMGASRDFAARVQKLRKSSGLREHDQVEVYYGAGEAAAAISNHLDYTNSILKVASLLPTDQMPANAVVIGREAGDDTAKLLEIVLTRRTAQVSMPKFVALYGEKGARTAESFILSMDFEVVKAMLEENIQSVPIRCGDQTVDFQFVLGENTFLSQADLLKSK
eukprot:TRINITY_DN883_c0_g1_i1.p1 TRINITY_DN883_c0_g1~~TRINITY_DN883_c0_g1_i1.p1  ORF type:complete len:296 (-),score=91.46 TRINITY_DN883_c0_g1_i1:70-957(-)